MVNGNRNIVRGNFVGVRSDGTTGFANEVGIEVNGDHNRVGQFSLVRTRPATTADKNVVSSNTFQGIVVSGSNNELSGNLIGVGSDGETILGNGEDGVLITSMIGQNTIGDQNSRLGNVIAYNGRNGIATLTDSPNTISANDIFGNAELGIDLGKDGATANDEADSDAGNQNFPEFNIAPGLNSLSVFFRVPSEPGNARYPIRAEFFVSEDGKQGRFLSAESFTESDFLNGDELKELVIPDFRLEDGESIIATATDSAGHSSEFSPPEIGQIETFFVTNTSDSGPGSLRDAILAANENKERLDTIAFNIPENGEGTFRITPLSALPDISDPVILDGRTQPGYAGKPIIEISGENASDSSGFVLTASDSLIQGFAIGGFFGLDFFNQWSAGITVRGQNNAIRGNYLGTDVSGEIADPNKHGIVITGTNNRIGGLTDEDRNLLSGNRETGVLIQNNSNHVFGNLIGTTADGGSPLGNGEHGVRFQHEFSVTGFQRPKFNTIGGFDTRESNVIAYNSQGGIDEFRSSFEPGNSLLGNAIFQNNNIGIDGGANHIPLLQVEHDDVANRLNVAYQLVDVSANSAFPFHVEFFFADGEEGESLFFVDKYSFEDFQAGSAEFQIDNFVLADGQAIVATATDNDGTGSTSRFSPPEPRPPKTFFVTNTNDDGPGSLRDAIEGANEHKDKRDFVFFDIPTSPDVSTYTIELQSPLPDIIDPIVLDARTQTGYEQLPIIEISGKNLVGPSGIRVATSDSIVQGFIINDFVGNQFSNNYAAGISIRGANNLVRGNFLGTDATGTSAAPNKFGISIERGGGENIIGGANLEDRNVISGNLETGIQIDGTSDNEIYGNYIGTKADGVSELGNGEHGLDLAILSPFGITARNVVGGLSEGQGNVIAFNGGNGIRGFEAGAYLSNSIFSNGDVGIFHNRDLVRPPQFSVSLSDDSTTIDYRIPTLNDTDFPVTLQFFLTDEMDEEGKTLLASETIDLVEVNQSHQIVLDATFEEGQKFVATTTTAQLRSSAFSFPEPQPSQVFVVTNPNEDGPGSLAQAIRDANLNIGARDTIEFDIPSDNQFATIQFSTTTLPTITDPVVIDGWSQGSDSERPYVELRGDQLPLRQAGGSLINGITVNSSFTTIQGLVINGFETAGINIEGGTESEGVIVRGNYIGTDLTGMISEPNGNGVRMVANNIQIGGLDATDRNVISGNLVNGVEVHRNSSTILGNYIGVAADGVSDLGNMKNGVEIFPPPFPTIARDNTIGGTEDGAGNVIGFNHEYGVSQFSIIPNSILGNSIFANRTGGISYGNNMSVQNDDLDRDQGRQNTPLFEIEYKEDGTDLLYLVPSDPQFQEYPIRVEFFLADHDQRQGRTLVAADSYEETDFTSGVPKRISLPFVASEDDRFVATATDSAGFTSLYSILQPTQERTFVVTNVQDSGPGSFRQAILDANSNYGSRDTITFDIPSETPDQVHTIRPLNRLPQINDDVIIDGWSQSETGIPDHPLIELDGSGMFFGFSSGLWVTASNSIFQGLAINRFRDAAMLLQGDNNILRGSHLGTDPTGLVARPNSEGLSLSGSNNTIGGINPWDANVISGNRNSGIIIRGDHNVMQGNYIGTGRDKNVDLGNGTNGISLSHSSVQSNVIGDADSSLGNTIGFNGRHGIQNSSDFPQAILGNSIFQNDGLGIEIGFDGSSFNDPGDIDPGRQNYPEFSYSTEGNFIRYSVPSSPDNSAYPIRVEFFIADAQGQEGETLIAADSFTVTDFWSGQPRLLALNGQTLPAESLIVATATDANGFTSEFSPAALPQENIVDDDFDQASRNDSFAQATPLGVVDDILSNLSITSGDEDWFGWTAPSSGPLAIDIRFESELGDLNLEVFDAANRLIDSSFSTGDNEFLELAVIRDQDYFFRVYPIDEDGTNPQYEFSLLLRPTSTRGFAVLDGGPVFVDVGDQVLRNVCDSTTTCPDQAESRFTDAEVGPNGFIYIGRDIDGANGGSGEIRRFSAGGQLLEVIALPEDTSEANAFTYPSGFDVLNSGAILIVQPASKRIIELSADGKSFREIDSKQILCVGGVPNCMDAPIDVAMSDIGLVYVTSQSDELNLVSGQVNPGRNGEYYVAVSKEENTAELQRFTPSDERGKQIHLSGITRPIEAQLLPDDSLYVVGEDANGLTRMQQCQVIDDECLVVSETLIVGTTNGMTVFGADPSPKNTFEDTDGDGLPNAWEENGLDFDGDGEIDLDLPALGADPNRKDVFVEIDTMLGRAPTPIEDEELFARIREAGLTPTGTSLDFVTASFLNAPVVNPDGSEGVRLHLQLDEIDIPLQEFNKALGPWTEYAAIKRERFGTADERQSDNWNLSEREAKRLVYRYTMFADRFQGSRDLGIAETPGNDILIVLGGVETDVNGDGVFVRSEGDLPPEGWPEQQATTFMHELGHVFGLRHGGRDQINYKPNYFSVMNAHWADPHADMEWLLDFSRSELPAIDEAAPDHHHVIIPDEFVDGHFHAGFDAEQIRVNIGPVAHLQAVSPFDPVDWHREGQLNDPVDINRVHWDVNNDGFVNHLDESPGELLRGYDDWSNLRFRFTDLQSFPEFGDKPRVKLGFPDIANRIEHFPADRNETVASNDTPDSPTIVGAKTPPGLTIHEGDGDWYGWIQDVTGAVVVELVELLQGVLTLALFEGTDDMPTQRAVLTEGSVRFELQAGKSYLLRAAGPGQSRYNIVFDQELIGDFDEDQQLTAADIDILSAAIREDSEDLRFDINRDGIVNSDDHQRYVRNLLAVPYGDANLDGRFDSRDLIAVFASDQYEDDDVGNAGWADGDWNGDGEFTSEDVILAFGERAYTVDAVRIDVESLGTLRPNQWKRNAVDNVMTRW